VNPSDPVHAAVTLPFLGELVVLFSLSGLIAYLCYRVGIAPIVGYLIAGALVGPFAFGLVEDVELVDYLAEIGVILLLFTIGVEFSLSQLREIGRFIVTGGGLQVGVTTAVTVAVLSAFGIDWQTAVFTGCLAALSSTAIVLGLLSERAETDSPSGKLSLGILIFQDLAIIAMVLLVPILGGRGGGSAGLLWVLIRALVIVSAVVFLARLVVPRILDWVARTRRQELFLLTVVAICFGTAWLTSLVGVSLALGAFLAGLIVSESHFREQALSEVLPLRTIFTAVFFVSVGMLFDMGFILERPLLLLAIAAGVVVVKFLVTTGSVLALGYPVRTAAIVGVGLAQIGEFSFVLQRAGAEVGLTPAGLGAAGNQGFLAVAVLLMIATPFMMSAAPAFGTWLSGLVPIRTDTDESMNGAPVEDHVIVVGYGPAGSRLVHVLHNTGIPYIVIELNSRTVDAARESGIPIFYGDAARLPILEAASLHRAKVLVVAINDHDATMRIVSLARYENPTLQILARTRFLVNVDRLQAAGADLVVPEELEMSVRLFSNVLHAYMVPADEVARHVDALRADDYGVGRGSIQEAHMMVLQGLDEEGLHTRAVALREGAPLVGRTLADVDLRNRFGLTVLAVRRGDRTIGSPAGTFSLEAGDRLVLIGRASQFATCSDLFRSPTHETAAQGR
jgi:CPA2 family monovalent cation:H+ antiporter-2